jgi:hypothetical protein
LRIEFTLTDADGKTYRGIAELTASAPGGEMNVGRVQATIATKPKGLPDHILALREAGFFREPRSSSEVHAKLMESYHCLPDRVQMALLRLYRRRDLRKTVKKDGDQEQSAYTW